MSKPVKNRELMYEKRLYFTIMPSKKIAKIDDFRPSRRNRQFKDTQYSVIPQIDEFLFAERLFATFTTILYHT